MVINRVPAMGAAMLIIRGKCVLSFLRFMLLLFFIEKLDDASVFDLNLQYRTGCKHEDCVFESAWVASCLKLK